MGSLESFQQESERLSTSLRSRKGLVICDILKHGPMTIKQLQELPISLGSFDAILAACTPLERLNVLTIDRTDPYLAFQKVSLRRPNEGQGTLGFSEPATQTPTTPQSKEEKET